MTKPANDLLLSWAYHWEQEAPDRVFLTQPTGNGKVKDYTWRQTMDEARRIAAHLRSLNFPPKSQIALIGKNSAQWFMTDLAIWMAGHVTVPLYPTLTAETVKYILEHSESKLLFVGKLDTWPEMKPGVPKGMPMIALPLSPPDSGMDWEDILVENEPIPDDPQREAEEMATIVYTSGTTGQPKGVMLSFGSMAAAAQGMSAGAGFSSHDRMISYLPLAHVYERAAVEGTNLRNGGHVFFAESVESFLQDLQRARPTIFLSVPRLWLRFQAGVFAKMPKDKLERLLSIPILSRVVRRKVLKGLGLEHCRFAVSGAAPVPPDVLRWYQKLGLDLMEGYGMSENFAYSHPSVPGQAKLGYVGKAGPGVEQRISPEGELQVKTPSMMMGYFKESKKTAEVFTEDGFFKTGDLGEIDAQGYLKITGRLKEIFKTSKGKYVAPAPIENHLVAHHLIEQACVTGSGYAQPFALVMMSEEARALAGTKEGREKIAAELEELRIKINAQLNHHEALEFLAVVQDEWAVENGLITPTLKIKRAAVEKRYEPFYQGWFDGGKRVAWEAA